MAGPLKSLKNLTVFLHTTGLYSLVRCIFTLWLILEGADARFYNGFVSVKKWNSPSSSDNYIYKPEDKHSSKPSKGCEKRFSIVSPKHTMCLDVNIKRKDGVSRSQRDNIVARHNFYRANVHKYNRQPRAADMLKLVWDNELAELAQKWASNCYYEHEELINRNIPGGISVGQNLARGQRNWKVAIRMWHDEYRNFVYGKGSRGGPVGHYTQMVWSSTTKIGCGFAMCNGTKPFYVCNYGPTGNKIDQMRTPYKKGPTGSACPKTFDRKSGLCNCGGMACKNGGVLDLNTCKCKCPGNEWNWYRQPDCSLNCEEASDYLICAKEGGTWGKEACDKYPNVGYEYCPITCRLCPIKGNTYYGEAGANTLTNSLEQQHDEGDSYYDEDDDDYYDYYYEEEENDKTEKPTTTTTTTTTPRPTTTTTRSTTTTTTPTTTTPTTTTTTPTTTTTTPTTTTTRPTTTTTKPTTTTTKPTTTTRRTTKRRKTTTSKPVHRHHHRKPSREDVKKDKPNLPDCTMVDPAMCGQPGGSHWPKQYCTYRQIQATCPAMCGRCAARQCQDYYGRRYDIGEHWDNHFGRFKCTYSGVVVQKGCYLYQKKLFIPLNGHHVYTDSDSSSWKWTCACDNFSRLSCKASPNW